MICSYNTTNTSQDESFDENLTSNLAFYVEGIGLPMVSLIGVIVIPLNIYMLTKSKFAIARILLVMAWTDLAEMILIGSFCLIYRVHGSQLAPEWNGGQQLSADYAYYVWYKIWIVPVCLLGFISNWCAVLISVFRVVAAYSPLNNTLTTKRKMTLSVALVCIVSIIAHIPRMTLYRLDEYGAIKFDYSSKLFLYNSIFLYITGLFIPICVCFISTFLLMRKLRSTTNSLRLALSSVQIRERCQQNKEISSALLLIIFLFAVLNTPNAAKHVWFSLYSVDKYQSPSQWRNREIFRIVSEFLRDLWYMLNFLIFLLANGSFRESLKNKMQRAFSSKSLLPNPVRSDSSSPIIRPRDYSSTQGIITTST